MKGIINIIIDFLKTHKKPLVIFTSALISLGVICGIFIYNNGVQNKKEKELLSRIENLEEQIKKQDELSEDIKSDADIVDSGEETSTNNEESDVISQDTNKENSNNNLSSNNTNTGQANNKTPTNTDIESSTQTKNDMPVGGNTENIGTTDKVEGGSNMGIPTIDMGTPYGSYSVTLYPPTNNFSDYEITDYNYSDNTVYSDNEQSRKIEGTLSVTVKCTSDNPNITVKYVVKDSSGKAITNGEYEMLTAQSSGKGSVCTLTGILYFPLTQEHGRYSVEFVE